MIESASRAPLQGDVHKQALNVTLEVDMEVADELVGEALIRTVRAHPSLSGGSEPTVDGVDLRETAPAARRTAAFDVAEEFCRTVFDAAGPRVRACHVRLGESSLIALAIDPGACDAWSANIIADEISDYIDAHLHGVPVEPVMSDDGPTVMARRADAALSPQGREARDAARERAGGLSRAWWPEILTTGEPCGTPTESGMRDLDDAAAEALSARCRAARASIFPLALLSLQLLQSDPVTPRAVISTFAARESEEDYVTVGHLAVDVLVPATLRGLTVHEALTAIRDDVFDILGTPAVPWQEAAAETGVASGLTVSVLYLPAQLSGGSTSASSHVTRASISVCPTGADLDLFVIERPPVDDQGRTPLLRLGGMLNRQADGFDLTAVLERWAACLMELATTDTPWPELPWPAVASRMTEGA